ncbi:MAG: hypothetical protein IJ738_02000 [Alphaproteobacteria bacterium]|nr:hypothetical protein [Alphaproteobacteria bacterium]MBR1756324.1 hypothetical protein [Alphaproteobacteria bacterium]
MREDILKAVAQPPKFLFAPFVPALVNLGIQFPVLFIAIGVANMNPLFFIFSILLSHAAITAYGIKEPHMSTMLQAYGQTRKVSKNLYSVKGNKFAP